MWIYLIGGVAGLLLLVLAVVVFLVAPGAIPASAKKMSAAFYGVNCAHRGLFTADQSVPENSLPAFRAARESGYGVELDVQLSADGQVVVIHDDDLLNACGEAARVDAYTFAELGRFRLFGTAEHIPLFTEVLDVLGDAPVIVELKSSGSNNALLCAKTLDILRKQGIHFCVESFDPFIVQWFKKNAPDLLRGQLSNPGEYFPELRKLQAFMLGNLMGNFLGRPHFVAYDTSPWPWPVRLCMAMKPMKVAWTVHQEDGPARFERENDCVIFEHYLPRPRFKTKQQE